MGKPVVMGRKPSNPLVIHSAERIRCHSEFRLGVPGIRVVGGLAEAFKIAAAQADLDGTDELW